MSRIIVTGSSGFLGRHLRKVLEGRYSSDELVFLSSKDYDLTDSRAVDRMFHDLRPERVIHLAAYSAGIGANKAKPADFFYQNSLFVTLMFEAAARHGVQKMIYTMGGCSYPADAQSPIAESCMWDGYPQPESAGYSMAKKMGLAAAHFYSVQYGLDTTVLVPGNMYGEYDNFRKEESHVIPAMIRRYYETQSEGLDKITMWGDGSPIRDFVYAGDVAKVIPFFLENEVGIGPFNISSGNPTTIRELAELIRDKLGWQGEIEWDSTKPNGQPVKIFDVTRLRSMGLECPTSLSAGLKPTIDWFCENVTEESDGIRL